MMRHHFGWRSMIYGMRQTIGVIHFTFLKKDMPFDDDVTFGGDFAHLCGLFEAIFHVISF